jgi:hypothetical protein
VTQAKWLKHEVTEGANRSRNKSARPNGMIGRRRAISTRSAEVMQKRILVIGEGKTSAKCHGMGEIIVISG